MKPHATFTTLAIALTGCMSTAPYKVMNQAQTTIEIESANGSYKVVDSRANNVRRIARIKIAITGKRGVAEVYREGSSANKVPLFNCEIANAAQSNNFGGPADLVESMTRCDVYSDYRYAHIYIAKVRQGYWIRDAKLFQTFQPMEIKSGYVIEYADTIGGGVLLDAAKD